MAGSNIFCPYHSLQFDINSIRVMSNFNNSKATEQLVQYSNSLQLSYTTKQKKAYRISESTCFQLISICMSNHPQTRGERRSRRGQQWERLAIRSHNEVKRRLWSVRIGRMNSVRTFRTINKALNCVHQLNILNVLILLYLDRLCIQIILITFTWKQNESHIVTQHSLPLMQI